MSWLPLALRVGEAAVGLLFTWLTWFWFMAYVRDLILSGDHGVRQSYLFRKSEYFLKSELPFLLTGWLAGFLFAVAISGTFNWEYVMASGPRLQLIGLTLTSWLMVWVGYDSILTPAIKRYARMDSITFTMLKKAKKGSLIAALVGFLLQGAGLWVLLQLALN